MGVRGVGEGLSPTSSLTLKDNIWKQAGEEAVVQPHTLIPQHGPEPCQGGEKKAERETERGREIQSRLSLLHLLLLLLLLRLLP